MRRVSSTRSVMHRVHCKAADITISTKGPPSAPTPSTRGKCCSSFSVRAFFCGGVGNVEHFGFRKFGNRWKASPRLTAELFPPRHLNLLEKQRTVPRFCAYRRGVVIVRSFAAHPSRFAQKAITQELAYAPAHDRRQRHT